MTKKAKRGAYGVVVDSDDGGDNAVVKTTALFERLKDGRLTMCGNNLFEAVLSCSAIARNLSGCIMAHTVKLTGYKLDLQMQKGVDTLHNYAYSTPASQRVTHIKDILKDLVHALQQMHDAGVAHCDLKPCNIVVMSDDRVRLIDFGSARFHTRGLPDARRVWCTYPFSAPEAFLDGPRGAPHPACDAFSLGATLLNVLHRVYITPSSWTAKTMRDYYGGMRADGVRVHPSLAPVKRFTGVPAYIYDKVLPGLLTLDPAERLTVAELHAHFFGSPGVVAAIPPPPEHAGLVCVSTDAAEADLRYLRERCSTSDTMETVVNLALGLRNRIARAGRGAVTHDELDACLLLAEGALYPDSDALDDVRDGMPTLIARVLRTVGFDVLACGESTSSLKASPSTSYHHSSLTTAETLSVASHTCHHSCTAVTPATSHPSSPGLRMTLTCWPTTLTSSRSMLTPVGPSMTTAKTIVRQRKRQRGPTP